VLGVDAVREALQAGRVACLVVASDASTRTEEKAVRLARAREVPTVTGPSAEAMGARLGRPAVMAVAVVERALARGVLDLAPNRGSTEV
jgi:ribosomal protein L7Ae-like RNA K-turn-binding protein